MKKILAILFMIFTLFFSSQVLAWENACVLQDYQFIKSGDYILMDFTDEVQFGPAPDCGGHVTILCPDDRECVLPYAVWGDIVIVGEDKDDMNFKLVGDDRLVPQNNSNWEDVLARNGCPASELEPEPEPEPATCGTDHIDLCENQTVCEIVGGYWYNEECNKQAQEPSSECPECPECVECIDCPECPTCDIDEEPFFCPLIGNVYRFDDSNTTFELSNFNCEVGPGCQGTFDLWHGDLKDGPLYRSSLPFSCQENVILISGLPCAIKTDGSLKCLGAVTENYHCYQVGNKTFCFSEEKPIFVFERE